MTSPSEDCALVGLWGSYLTGQQEAVIDRINEIRKEAMGEDYTEMKWSTDMEYIARIRAAEMGITGMGNTRPNGNSVFSLLSPEGRQSYSEIRLSGYSSMLKMLDNWYEEKGSYYNKLLSKDYTCIGMGIFSSKTGNTCAVEFGYDTDVNEGQLEDATNILQTLEVSKDYISDIELTGKTTLEVGEESAFIVTAKTTVGEVENQVYLTKATYQSENPRILTVDDCGLMKGKKVGTTNVTIDCGDIFSQTQEVQVVASSTEDYQESESTDNEEAGNQVVVNGTNTWNQLNTSISYETYVANSYVKIESGLANRRIYYYIDRGGSGRGLSANSLDGITEWKTYTGIFRLASGKNVVYVKIIDDDKDQVYYLCTGGLDVEKKASTTTSQTTKPSATATATANQTAKNSASTSSSSQSSNASVVKPSRVKIKKALNKSGRKILLKWKKVKTASGYQIQYSLKRNFKGKKTKKATKTKCLLKKLKKGKTYYIRIRAYTTSGGSKVNGKWSKVKKVKVKK